MAGRTRSPTARSCSRCRSAAAIRISKCSPPKGSATRLRVPIIGQAQFVETGHLVYSFLGNLMAVRFDLEERAIDGVPVAVAKGHSDVERIRRARPIGVLRFREQARSCGCAPAHDEGKSRLVRVERDGKVSPLVGAAGRSADAAPVARRPAARRRRQVRRHDARDSRARCGAARSRHR